MSEKNQNTTISHITFSVIFLVAILAIVFLTDPSKSTVAVLLLYAAIAGFCMNFFVVLLENFIYRQKRAQESAVPVELHHTKIAARQALMLTILVLGLMFLSASQLLHWWVAGIFILALIFIEGFFLVN